MSKTSKTTTAAPAVKPLSNAIAQGIIDRGNAVVAAQTSGDTAVTTAEWARFHATVDALRALGSYLMGASVAGKVIAGKPTSGDALRKLHADKTSGVYIDDRSDLPSAATYGRAVALFIDDTAARRTAFESAGNLPKLTDYLPWLNLAAGRKASNASNVDVDKTVTGKGASRKVGKLVRKPSARQSTTTTTSTAAAPIAAVVPEWGIMTTWSDEQLTAATAGVDLSNVPADKRAGIARQLIALILIDERASKTADLAITISV